MVQLFFSFSYFFFWRGGHGGGGEGMEGKRRAFWEKLQNVPLDIQVLDY